MSALTSEVATMPVHVSKAVRRRGAVVGALGFSVIFGAGGVAAAEVAPGPYTSTTVSAGSVLLSRDARVEGREFVLIGRYPIHPTETGGYVDLFAGHRVFLDADGRGGYTGPAFLGPIRIGEIVLTPRR